MKPKIIGDTTRWYVCGECGNAVDPRDNYCPECGDRINWDTQSMDTLKPCPFCGGEVEISPKVDYWEIRCDDCRISMWRSKREWLVAAWNRRIGGARCERLNLGFMPVEDITTEY